MEKYYQAELEVRAQATYDNCFNHTLHAHIDIAGDLVAGTLLSRILYWFAPNKEGRSKLRVIRDNKYWLAKERSDWWNEIRITDRQFDRASKDLEKKGLITRKIFKYGRSTATHIRPNFQTLNDAINDYKNSIKEKIQDKEEVKNTSEPVQSLGITQSVIQELHKVSFGNNTKCNSGVTQSVIPSIQGLQTGITNRDYKQQQQKDENRVVVVREKYESLFQKKLTNEQAEDLITLSDKYEVDVLHKIENTHEYHTKVERCRSIMASVKRAITHGDWEIARVEKKQSKPLPKAVREQFDQKKGSTTQKVTKYTPEQIAHAKAEIERKKALLYADSQHIEEEAL